MATATPTPPSKTPDVQTLRKRRETIQAQHDAYKRRHDEIHNMIGALHVVTGSENFTAADCLRAEVDKPEVGKQLRLATAELKDLDVEIRAAEDAEREHKRDKYTLLKRATVGKLDALFVKVAEINRELARIEDEETSECGRSPVTFSWHEFHDETPLTGSRLASWRRSAREHLMLD